MTDFIVLHQRDQTYFSFVYLVEVLEQIILSLRLASHHQFIGQELKHLSIMKKSDSH